MRTKGKYDKVWEESHICCYDWTAVSNKNHFRVAPRIIDDDRKLQSLALSMQKTISRHFGHNCADD